MNTDRLLIELANSHGGFLHRHDVRQAGVTSRRWCRLVDAGTWLELVPDVYCHVAIDPVWELRVRATMRWLGRKAALFGPTAAAWWMLDGSSQTSIEVVVAHARRSVPPRVVLHTTRQWSTSDLLVHRGVRLTGVTRTVIDLARTGAPVRSIESAIDSGIRLRLTSLPTLRRRLHDLGGRGHCGTVLLRELLLDSGGESLLERRFLRLVRASGFARPRCQVVFRSGSRTVARVDFLFGERVVVEVSGRLGHSSDSDRRKDAHRRNDLQQRGIQVLEFTTVDVLDDPTYVLSTLRLALSTVHRPTTDSVVSS